MTLLRQMVLAIMVLMVLLYGVNGAVSLASARALIDGQMVVHASDAATALAVAVSQGEGERDPTVLEALFNALSDSGYYQRVALHDADGGARLSREFALDAPDVPGWFVRWMALPDHVGRADVVEGWSRVGEVVVVSHPGQAQQQLWQLAKRQLSGFAAAAALFCVLGLLALRQLLAPLRGVVAQADGICEQRFAIQERMPRAPELRVLVEAMNRMALRLQQLFAGQAGLIADLRRAAAQDDVTGLANRAEFDARLEAQIAESGGSRPGLVAILALDSLAQINDRHGRAEGNELLRVVGVELRTLLAHYPEALVARRQGAEFAVFVADLTSDEADAMATALVQRAGAAPFAHRDSLPLSVRLGYSFGEAVGRGANLLEEAGLALTQLTATTAPNVRRYDGGSPEAPPPLVSRTGADWVEIIDALLAQRALQLLVQPTLSVPERTTIGCELYSRAAPPVAGSLPGAAALLPAVERAGRAAAYDRLVLELLSRQTLDHPRLTVNLSPQSLRTGEWLAWLDEFLDTQAALAARLVFEIPERAIAAFPEQVHHFQRLIEAHGAALGVDHFGIETSNFAYLGSLPLAHVKLHRSLVKDLHQRPDGRFYVKSLAHLTHSREIPLLAEGIETEAEWQVLAELDVDGAQGFFLGHPQPLT